VARRGRLALHLRTSAFDAGETGARRFARERRAVVRVTGSTGAPEVVGFTVADPPAAWRAAGFALAEGADVVQIGSVSLRCAGRGVATGIVDWTLRSTVDRAADVDGLRTRFEAEAGRTAGFDSAGSASGSTPDHPNGALFVDHVVVLSPDLDRTTTAFESCGMQVRRVRETTAGGRDIRQVFFRAGEVIVEVVGPREAEPARAGAPAQMFGLAITVADLDAAACLLGHALGVPKAAVQEGRRIATLRHRELGMSVDVAFMSPRYPPLREKR